MDADELKRLEAYTVAFAWDECDRPRLALAVCAIPPIQAIAERYRLLLGHAPGAAQVIAVAIAAGFLLGRSFERSEQLERMVK